MPNPSLIGIGTALPRHKIAQALSAKVDCRLNKRAAEAAQRTESLYRKTKVQFRHSVLNAHGSKERPSEFEAFFAQCNGAGPTTSRRMNRYQAEAPGLGCEAAVRALASAGVPASRVTHLVTVSCTGFAAPGLDIALLQGLGLRPSIMRTHIGFMGCHGMFNALSVARAFAAQDSEARVLVASVELCSLHYAGTSALDRLVANALFADGASAAVVGQGKGLFEIAGFGSRVIPGSLDAMTWTIGDHGFEMGLSIRIPKLIGREIKGWVGQWLGQSGTKPADIRGWAIHPGGPRILDSAGEALGLSSEDLKWSYRVLKRNGNMSSATLIFILQEMRKNRVRGPLAAIGFGPGLTAEGMLLISS